jgi:amidase
MDSYSAAQIVKLIRQREISPVEVVQNCLSRIAELNPKLNAIVTMAPDVIEQARRAEASISRGDEIGPLHGLPITIKDTIETAGLLTTSGSRLRADFVPKNDAPAVARLKAAGAIILGKTNAAEMAMDYNADNPVFGRTNHPQDTSKTPGGSSGGEAVAIATGMSFAGLGSDLAGSIRIPAHFCGITGLKPSTGRVPGGGQFPPSIGPYGLGAVIGPMAKNVEDLELLFNVLSDDTESKPIDLTSTRVAWYANDDVSPVTRETLRAISAAANALANAGLRVEETRPPGVERGYDLWLKLFARASVVQLRNVYSGREEEGGSFVRWRLATADETPAPSLDEYIQSWMERDRLRSELLQWMDSVPLIIAPVGATHALPHDTLKVDVGGVKVGTFRAFSYSQTFSVFDLPSACVPVGRTADGFPIGVQIVGRPFEERLVLATARVLEVVGKRNE